MVSYFYIEETSTFGHLFLGFSFLGKVDLFEKLINVLSDFKFILLDDL